MDFPVLEEDATVKGEIDEIRHVDGFVRSALCSSYVPDIVALGNLTGIEEGVPARRPAQSNAIDQALALSLIEKTCSITGTRRGILTVSKLGYGPA